MLTITIINIFMIIIAYFIGSISSSILICKFLSYTDPRNYGSKNPGATNVFRIAGYRLAIGVVLFDILKGSIPIWLGSYFKISNFFLNILAISVCIGHIYPIFFKFFGGKGVATAFGSLIAININFAIIAIITWVLTILIFKYVSLGSILTAVILPFYAWYIQHQYFFFIILLSLLILIRHTENIKRLWNHQEKSIWDR